MRRTSIVLLLVCLAVLVSGLVQAQDTPVAYFRFEHNASNFGAVTLYINGTRTEVQNAQFGTVTRWYPLRADNVFRFEIGPDATYNATTRLVAGSYYTVTLNSIPGSSRPALVLRTAPARVRVAHLAQGTGAVDVYVNGNKTDIQGLSFGSVSEWVTLPSGVTQFSVGLSGREPNLNTTSNLRGATWNTIVAVGSSDGRRVQLRVISEDYGLAEPNVARVTVLHAVPGLFPVNFNVDGTNFIQNLGFPGTLGNNDGVDTVRVAGGTRNIRVTSTVDPSQVLFDLANTSIIGGRAYLIAAFGLPDRPQLLVTSTDAETINAR